MAACSSFSDFIASRSESDSSLAAATSFDDTSSSLFSFASADRSVFFSISISPSLLDLTEESSSRASMSLTIASD